jgi:hypothetical protein
MSDNERGDARAQGAFDHFIKGMTSEMGARQRSPEYVLQFWATLQKEMEQFCNRKVN